MPDREADPAVKRQRRSIRFQLWLSTPCVGRRGVTGTEVTEVTRNHFYQTRQPLAKYRVRDALRDGAEHSLTFFGQGLRQALNAEVVFSADPWRVLKS